MRNLGIVPRLFSRISQLLIKFPRYAGKEVSPFTVLVAYMEFSICHRPPVKGFADKFEKYFGSRPNQMKNEYQELKGQFSRLTLSELIRFVMPEYIGDVEGVLKTLHGMSLVESVYLLGQALNFDGEPPTILDEDVDDFEMDDDSEDGEGSTSTFERWPESATNQLQISVEKIAISNNDYIYSGEFDELVLELLDDFPEPELKDIVLDACKKTAYEYRAVRSMDERLFNRIRQFDSLDLYEILCTQTEFFGAKIEAGLVYELLTSTLDISSKNHMLMVDPSVHFLNKWLQDEITRELRATFLFTDQLLWGFARCSKRFRERQEKTNLEVYTIEDWTKFNITQLTKLPKVNVAYINVNPDGNWTKHATELFDRLCDPVIAQDALVYFFGLPMCTHMKQLHLELHLGEPLTLATFGVILGKTNGSYGMQKVVSCYYVGQVPAMSLTHSQMPFVYEASAYQDDILLSLVGEQRRLNLSNELDELINIRVVNKKESPPEAELPSKQTNVEVLEFSPEIQIKMRKIFRKGSFDGVCAYCTGPIYRGLGSQEECGKE